MPQYHGCRRNAIAYNPDLTCTSNELGLVAHILAIEPHRPSFASKFAIKTSSKSCKCINY